METDRQTDRQTDRRDDPQTNTPAQPRHTQHDRQKRRGQKEWEVIGVFLEKTPLEKTPPKTPPTGPSW